MMQSLHHAEPISGEGRKLIDWDLGVYDAPFAVLKNAASASILMELGVLIHPDEELLLEQPAYRSKMVEHVLAALNEYCAAASAADGGSSRQGMRWPLGSAVSRR
jgi:N-acetylmuramoyl-L-alanine amidase